MIAPSAFRHVVETDSTQSDALEAYENGETGPLWVSASRQTAGIGRRGRAWTHTDGNFAGTLLWPLDPDQPIDVAAHVPFLIGLAARDTMIAHGLPADVVRLKWPNDVLADGRKLAGCLVSLAREPGRGNALAIGIGINLRVAPSLAENGAAAASEWCSPPPASGLAWDLDAAFRERWAMLQQDGFAAIRAAWLDVAAFLGQTVAVSGPDRTDIGTFTDIDERGAIRLQTERGRLTFTAGDVSLRPHVDNGS